MCGITGFYTLEGHDSKVARDTIKRMADTLHYRGPDEEGYFVDENVALGHRRLSIIDLSSGQQPMPAKNGRFQIVFNGEIYNYLEIRQELLNLGHIFQTRSDTETILMAYAQWGDECVKKLSGMFAFAIWDKTEKTLFLARDRVGKKPLYYHWNGRIFSFASELKALQAAKLCAREIDYQALDCYYTFGYIPSPRTIYKNTCKLEPAHILRVSQNGINKERYWQLYFSPQDNITLDEATDEFESLLDEATKCRLMSEVPLGAFLSGGLDSTLVVSSMAKNMSTPVLTNSIGFGEKRYNELPLAKMVSEYLRTNHKELTLEPKAAEILSDIAWHFDEPFADSSAVPTWYVCKMAKQNVTVVLSGDGGDESFGGYTFRYLPHMFESTLRNKIPVALRSILFGSLGSMWPASVKIPKPLRLKTIFENLAVSDAEAFYKDLIWLRSDNRARLYKGDFMSSLKGFTPFETVKPLYDNLQLQPSSPEQQALSRAQFTDINFYMTEDVLVKVDRISMAHSLEIRSPLLDHRIIEFAATLPSHLKLDKRKGKIVLRNLASRRLPRQILDQPKTGFSIPAGQWLRNELKPMAEAAVFKKTGLAAQTLDRKELTRIWNEHQSSRREHSVFLWVIMMLDLWERAFYNTH
jgi:asparagine synthase (glutamine-hydrolysing)